MKWTFIIKNKIAASLSLLILCALVLFSNYQDRRHTEAVKKSINSLYQDRLLAEVYIHKLNSDLFRMKELLLKAKVAHQADFVPYFNSISKTLNDYRQTKFTNTEKEVLTQFQTVIDQNIKASEITLTDIEWIEKGIELTEVLLDIQVEESKNIMVNSDILFKNSQISNQLSFSIVILILVVLQALVIASRNIVGKHDFVKSGLN